MSSPEFLVGLDIGGTKSAVLVVDRELNECSAAVAPTPLESSDRLLDGLVALVEEALRAAGASKAAAIGAGVPGKVAPDTGLVEMAVNLNLDRYPLGPRLARALGAPAVLENDVRLAAFGAFHRLSRQKTLANLIFIGIGTGIAAGIVLDGRIFRGEDGLAGEIGHAVVEENGARCSCGQHGCLETIVAGPALARQAAAAGHPVADAGEVYRLAVAGDPAARQIIERASRHLARMIQWLALTVNIREFVFGGGVTRSAEAFLEPIQAELRGFQAQAPFAGALIAPLRLSLLPADFNAGAWGGVRLARAHLDQMSGQAV